MNQHIQPKFKGNVGIFLLAAELSKMNLIALTTCRNTRGYDIVVFNPETNKVKGIQVKCTDKKDFPVVNTYLKTMNKELQKKLVCDFVFVDISGEYPRFFVLSKDNVCNMIIAHNEESLATSKHKKTLEEMMTSSKPLLHTLKLSQIEKYQNNWNQILQDLQ